MALSPSEILHKEFDSKFRGYDPDQVNDFLDIIVAEFEKLTADNQAMSSKMNDMQDKLNYFQQLQESLNSSIVVAQEAAERLKQNARKEAELILYEAEREADRLVEDATKKTQAIISETETLRNSSVDFKQKLVNMLESQLNLINRDEYQELFNGSGTQPAVSSLPSQSVAKRLDQLEQEFDHANQPAIEQLASNLPSELVDNDYDDEEQVGFAIDPTEDSLDQADMLNVEMDIEEFKPKNETVLGRTIRIDLPKD